MDLHRAGNRPDWLAVEPAQRNYWQRLAAATGGIVTPGNLLTVAGLAIALAGLGGLAGKHYWVAFYGLLAGRLLDLADGWAAARSGTKSPLGEVLDATVDKTITFAALLVLGASGLLMWWAILALALPHIIIAGLASRVFLTGRRLHPSRAGKLSMALAWLAITGLLLARAANWHWLLMASYAVGVLSAALGLLALTGYGRTSLKSVSA